MVIGHGPLGIVEKIGSDVANGFSAQCLTNNPGKGGAAYGYPDMGGYLGVQTELARVPFADANCLRLPGEPGDD